MCQRPLAQCTCAVNELRIGFRCLFCKKVLKRGEMTSDIICSRECHIRLICKAENKTEEEAEQTIFEEERDEAMDLRHEQGCCGICGSRVQEWQEQSPIFEVRCPLHEDVEVDAFVSVMLPPTTIM